MSDLFNSGFAANFKDVMSQNTNPAFYSWGCNFYIGNTKIPAFRVETIDILCDYTGSFADVIKVEAQIGRGTFAYDIYPNRYNLQAELTKTPVNEATRRLNAANRSKLTERFDVVLQTNKDPMVTDSRKINYSKAAMDQMGLVTIRFELINQVIGLLRNMEIGTVTRGHSVKDVLTFLLSHTFNNLPISMDYKPKGVVMASPDNTTPQEVISIEDGVRIMDLPRYIQTQACGVYSSGLGAYLHNGYLHIYPLYDGGKSISTEAERLLIYNVPSDAMPHLNVTFKNASGYKKIITTGGTNMLDQADMAQRNTGNGTRYTNMANMFDTYGQTENNQTVIDRKSSFNEYVYQQRNNNYAPLSNDPFTSNEYEELSRLASKSGIHIQVAWENSEPTFISPGMRTTFNYISNGREESLEGRICGAHHFISVIPRGADATQHQCNTSLTMFLRNK